MNRSQLKADSLYYIRDDGMFFYTPDAVGGYWYETVEEVCEAGFGDFRINYIQALTDW